VAAKLRVGDLAIHDSKMPWPNAIYRVKEVDKDGNFRGVVVFRIAPEFPQKIGGWLCGYVFRKVTEQELQAIRHNINDLPFKE